MKKLLLAAAILGSTLLMEGCGFNQACCPTSTCGTTCTTTTYSYSGGCGYNMCSRSWY